MKFLFKLVDKNLINIFYNLIIKKAGGNYLQDIFIKFK